MSNAKTHNLDLTVFEQVITYGTVERRMELARQLGQLMCDQHTPDAEKQAVVPILLSITTDPVTAVRRQLAKALAGAEGLNPDIVFAIVADAEDIAVEFLRKTHSLDTWRMVAILKVGNFARQQVIAMRGDIADAAVTQIVELGTPELATCLLDNACAPVTAAHCRRLYIRFADEPEIVDRLLERRDLPLEIRLMHAKRTANRVYDLMSKRGWMAANDAEEVVISAEEGTLLKLLEQASEDELDRVIPFMCEKNFLTPSIILRAACAGELRVVERALAYLSSIPPKRVHNLIYGNGTLSLKAVHKKSGLPPACYIILKAVFDVARDARRSGRTVPREDFGRTLIETLMVRYDGIPGSEKTMLLGMIAAFGDDRTKRIARRLSENLKRAA